MDETMDVCPECGRSSTLAGNVLAFVPHSPVPVRPDDVAKEFGIKTANANVLLCRHAAAGRITRIRMGIYSGDPELRRRAQVQLDRLTPRATARSETPTIG